jgi:hypothetical protein
MTSDNELRQRYQIGRYNLKSYSDSSLRVEGSGKSLFYSGEDAICRDFHFKYQGNHEYGLKYFISINRRIDQIIEELNKDMSDPYKKTSVFNIVTISSDIDIDAAFFLPGQLSDGDSLRPSTPTLKIFVHSSGLADKIRKIQEELRKRKS